MIKKLFRNSYFLFAVCYLLFTAPKVHAVCNLYALMSPTLKNVTASACSISSIEGIDMASTESSTVNSAVLTVPNAATVTINNGGTLIVGSLSIQSGGSVAIQAGGQIKLGAPLYVADADADGYPTDFTLYEASISGRRRLALMRAFDTVDCGDSTYNIGNTCGPTNYGDGHDGACNRTTTFTISAHTCVGRAYADGISFPVTGISSNNITLNTTANGIAVDDEVLLINLRGSTSSYTSVGAYETFLVTNVSGTTVTIDSAPTKTYGVGGNSNLTGQKVVLQRVPNYSSLTLSNNAQMNVNTFNGTQFGIIAFKVSGTLTISAGSYINADGRGHEGGSPYPNYDYGGAGGGGLCSPTAYLTTASAGAMGGGNITAGGNAYTNNYCGGGGGGGAGFNAYAGSAGVGSYGGAGGGGGGATRNANGYYGYGAGGGGGGGIGGPGAGGISNYSSGGAGSTSGASGAGGNGAYNVGGDGNNRGGGGGGGGKITIPGTTTALPRLYLGNGGGAGGAGSYSNSSEMYGGAGGRGGGIILIGASNIVNSQTWGIRAIGSGGGADVIIANPGSGGGGGGGGGSIKITTNTGNLGASSVHAGAGAGGGTVRPGGAGGLGGIAIFYDTSLSASTYPTAYTSQF